MWRTSSVKINYLHVLHGIRNLFVQTFAGTKSISFYILKKWCVLWDKNALCQQHKSRLFIFGKEKWELRWCRQLTCWHKHDNFSYCLRLSDKYIICHLAIKKAFISNLSFLIERVCHCFMHESRSNKISFIYILGETVGCCIRLATPFLNS